MQKVEGSSPFSRFGKPRYGGVFLAIALSGGGQAQFEEWEREWHTVGFGFWAVSLLDDARVIEFGGLTLRTFRERAVLNTYYRFAPSAWGQGYATEMGRAAVALAGTLLPELPVIVGVRPGNRVAQAVAEKLGLVHTPDLDDHMLTYAVRWNRTREGDGQPPVGPSPSASE